jgi:hypothetical protein
MLSILQREYDVLHQKGGKPPKLTVKDKLCYALMLRTWVKIGRKYTSKQDFLCKNTLKTAESGWV